MIFSNFRQVSQARQAFLTVSAVNVQRNTDSA